MKTTYTSFIYSDAFSSTEIYAQEERFYCFTKRSKSLLREGNEVYQKKKYTDASSCLQKSIRKKAQIQESKL